MNDAKYNALISYFKTLQIPAPYNLDKVSHNNFIRDTRNFKFELETLMHGASVIKTKRVLTKEGEISGLLFSQFIKNIHYIDQNVSDINWKKVIPYSMVEKIMQEAHQATGHGGRNKMRDYINTHYYIIGKEKWINQFKICKICERVKAHPKEQVLTPIESSYPFERLQMDLTFMLGKKNILFFK